MDHINTHDILMKRLRSSREKLGLTQKEAAHMMGIGDVTLSQYELGTRKPNPQTLRDVADVYNVTVDYLLGRVDDSQKTTEDISGILESMPNLSGNYDVVLVRKKIRELLKIKQLTFNGKPIPEDKAKIMTIQLKKWNDQLDTFVKMLDLFD
jgi:transcriptional regulator with XRE-family HTH domain